MVHQYALDSATLSNPAHGNEHDSTVEMGRKRSLGDGTFFSGCYQFCLYGPFTLLVLLNIQNKYNMLGTTKDRSFTE